MGSPELQALLAPWAKRGKEGREEDRKEGRKEGRKAKFVALLRSIGVSQEDTSVAVAKFGPGNVSHASFLRWTFGHLVTSRLYFEKCHPDVRAASIWQGHAWWTNNNGAGNSAALYRRHAA
ncbi:hypothetical protein AK812_SmicGene45548 [Symbiodinium microadriaticum]|uniref:Uncharacterized protein n=1 Tax=Symbiodinium microadriaticum TaxID=2951 RepID=A0A1Q9BVV9_SYMMI|nr:hypothetical protein AK812_SmicGene45548 [Symbiodinium microadriaticum]